VPIVTDAECRVFYYYAKCHYAECHSTECRDAIKIALAQQYKRGFSLDHGQSYKEVYKHT